MAGTDRSRAPNLGGPAVILVEPQLGENIGAAARAMLNFGLTDLRLVSPRDGWPNAKVVAAASGADAVIEAARVFRSTAESIADLNHVLAATVRARDMAKVTIDPGQAAQHLRRHMSAGAAAGILFGPERAGLSNDDLALADTILAIPTNPAFGSLNLAQSVLLIAYEWFVSGDGEGERSDAGGEPQATKKELIEFFEHLERDLDAGGFLKPPEKRPGMVRNLRNLFQRARLTEREVRTLRGVIVALTRLRGGPGK